MAKRKCAARVGYMNLSNMGFSPIKPCPKSAVVVETHTVGGTTYVNAYCGAHRNTSKDVSPSFKVEAL